MKKTTNNRKDPQKHSILLFFLSFDVSMNTPMKVYLNRRSHSFIDWRDEQKINVIKKLLCVEWVGCDLEFTSVSGINVGDCVHVRLYLCSVLCVPHLKKKDHFSEVKERKSECFSLLVTWLAFVRVFVFVPIGNELKFFWIDVIVKHWIVVYFVCAMANALHNRARSNAFLFNHFSFASSFDSTNRFSSFLIQQIQDQVKCEGFLRE